MPCVESLPLLTGPIFIGTIFGWCLFGTLVSQTYTYFLCYPDDSRGLKCLVAGLFALELLQTTLMTNYAWEMLINGFGSTNSLGLPWSAATLSPLIGLISMIVQAFYARRIYVLRVANSYPTIVKAVSVLIVLIAVIQGTAAIYGGIAFGFASTWENMVKLTSVVEIWLGGSLACDILIAGSMIVILARAGENFPWDRNDATVKLVNKLLVHAIETGAVTAITSLVDIVLFELYKDSSIHQTPASILGKLYTNALMVSLNGRKPIQYIIRQRSDLGQLQTSDFFSTRGDTMLTVRDTRDNTEGRKTEPPIMVEIPKSSNDSISEDDRSKSGERLDSPV